MEKISVLRKKIDEIDGKILCFLRERVAVCKSIGAIKREHGISIRDYQREDEVYTKIMAKASELELVPEEVKAIYLQIMAMSAHAQESDKKLRATSR